MAKRTKRKKSARVAVFKVRPGRSKVNVSASGRVAVVPSGRGEPRGNNGKPGG